MSARNLLVVAPAPLRRELVAALAAAGLGVVEAADRPSGLRRFREHAPDGVVSALDLTLGDAIAG